MHCAGRGIYHRDVRRKGRAQCHECRRGAQSDYGEITLFLAKHKTTDNIKHTKAFTVAFATKDTVEIADYFGVETGNKVNKIEKAGCHVHKSRHVNAPIIEEFPVTLECECTSYDDNTGILVGNMV